MYSKVSKIWNQLPHQLSISVINKLNNFLQVVDNRQYFSMQDYGHAHIMLIVFYTGLPLFPFEKFCEHVCLSVCL